MALSKGKKDKLEKIICKKVGASKQRVPPSCLLARWLPSDLVLPNYMTLFPFQQTGPRLGGGNKIKKKKPQGRLPKSVD